MLRYEIDALSALPHALIYTEGGYSDANTPAYAAQVLNAIGISKIRGFFTNDTHLQWTINEVRWATQGVTARPRRPLHRQHRAERPRAAPQPHPATQGIEDLCNPPDRGLGPAPSTQTGFALADAWLWTSPPG